MKQTGTMNKKWDNNKKPFKKKPFKKKEEEKFDVEKWLKQHQNIEAPKRSKANSLGDKKNKRRH